MARVTKDFWLSMVSQIMVTSEVVSTKERRDLGKSGKARRVCADR